MSKPDCNSIYHVAVKRGRLRGQHWLDVLHAYSAIDNRTANARKARALPDSDSPKLSESQNEGWRRLRQYARELVDGMHEDVCPRAIHWGSPTARNDVVRAERAMREGRWRPARCRGRLVNAYYVTVAVKGQGR